MSRIADDAGAAVPSASSEDAQDLPDTPGSIGDWVEDVESPPTEEVFTMNRAHATDNTLVKVNLGMGVYRDKDGNPSRFPSVICAEAELFAQQDPQRNEYLPEEGDSHFTQLASNLAFGPNCNPSGPENIISVQTISGSGANHLGALFLAKYLKPRHVWLSDPTWENHHTIWKQVGVPIMTYPHDNGTLDFLEANVCSGDVVVFQSIGHNPTGVDPRLATWVALARFCWYRHAFPFIDCAYQGLVSGDPAADRAPVRMFHETFEDLPMMLAQSFSKNFGLYGHRVGALHVVIRRDQMQVHAETIRANLCRLARAEYSIPPRYGSSIVAHILGNEQLYEQWCKDLAMAAGRIQLMRKELCKRLTAMGTPGDWDQVLYQQGMFSFIHLTPVQIDELRSRHHIYMLSSGRISLSGLTFHNIAYVVWALNEVITKYPEEDEGTVKVTKALL